MKVAKIKFGMMPITDLVEYGNNANEREKWKQKKSRRSENHWA
jgi:hypothetical protein